MSLIALVRPPLVLPHAMMNSSQGVPSIGVAYLAGSLKAAGHRVQVIAWFYLFQFLFRPWRSVESLYRLVTQQPKTMLERVLDGIFLNFIGPARRQVDEVETIPAAPMVAAARPVAARGPAQTFPLQVQLNDSRPLR
jgi:hypothetical protein